MLGRGRFGLFLVATSVSAVGDFLNSVAVTVVVYRWTHSAVWLGVAAFCRVGAWAAATAVGGVIGDRFDRRRVLVVSNGIAAGVGVAVWAVGGGGPAVAVFVVAVTALAFVSGVMNPSFAAAVPSLVSEDRLARANAAVTTVEQVSQVAGPALGSVVVAVSSPGAAFLLNAVSFALAAGLFAGVPCGGNTRETQSAEERGGAGLAEGWRAVRGSRSAGVLVSLFVAAVASYGFSVVVLVLVAVQRADLSAGSVGYLRMAEGAGGVVASLIAGRIANRPTPVALVVAGVGFGLAPIVIAVVHGAALVLGVLVLGGAAMVLIEVIIVTWLQRIVDDAVLARVMGLLMSLGAVGTAVGTVAAPVLDRAIGLRGTLVVSGAVPLVVIAVQGRKLRAVATEAGQRGMLLASKVEALAGLPLFDGAEPATLERLAAMITTMHVAPAVEVIREGDPSDDLFVVREGQLVVHASHDDEPGSRAVGELGAGDYFGEIGLVHRLPRTATVTTATPVVLWSIPGREFTTAFESLPLRPGAAMASIAGRLATSHPSWTLPTRDTV